jgi:release factor glutamine methyltransferase
MKTWTIHDIIDWSKGYLAERGFENARLETELLLADALGLSRIELYLDFERQLSEPELKRYKARFKRRLEREPVQYITGSAAFMLSDFEVTPDVLIPRPETEALTEVALELLAEVGGDEPLVADVGTGSGVIAVTLAQKVPEARVHASDSSSGALDVAGRNAERMEVAGRITFHEGRLLEPLREAGLEGRLALLVSNPPYIPSGDLAGLPEEVRGFEPRSALDGGEDGLDCLRALAQDGPGFLRDGGAIALEVGFGQADSVAGLLGERAGSVEIRKDYAGRDRIVVGRR